MTLAPFTPESLDQLALRMLDLAGTIRGMANASREHGLGSFSLHVNKVQEWMGRMEDWANDGSVKIETSIIKLRGARRAQTNLGAAPARSSRPARGKRKRVKK